MSIPINELSAVVSKLIDSSSHHWCTEVESTYGTIRAQKGYAARFKWFVCLTFEGLDIELSDEFTIQFPTCTFQKINDFKELAYYSPMDSVWFSYSPVTSANIKDALQMLEGRTNAQLGIVICERRDIHVIIRINDCVTTVVQRSSSHERPIAYSFAVKCIIDDTMCGKRKNPE